jgi:hypothetical protein
MKSVTPLSTTTVITILIAALSHSGIGWAHVISEADHHAFEHKFTEMCVDKEKARTRPATVTDDAIVTLCECIAKEESKRLTVEEVRKFVKENKYPVSLMIKSNAASYACIRP